MFPFTLYIHYMITFLTLQFPTHTHTLHLTLNTTHEPHYMLHFSFHIEHYTHHTFLTSSHYSVLVLIGEATVREETENTYIATIEEDSKKEASI